MPIVFTRRVDPLRLVAFLILLLGAMSHGTATCRAQAPEAPPAADFKPLGVKNVRLGYFANVTHAQAVLGVESGDFARAVAPAEFSTRIFNAGPSLIEALFAGEIDIGYVGPSPALAAHVQSRGRGVRIVAGAAGGGVVIVASPGSGIEKLTDLKGKRIATPQLGNTQDVSARHYLIHVLGQTSADNVLPVPNAEQAAMMTRGQIDAAWAVEPWGARLVAEAGGKIIAEEKDLWPAGNFTLTLVVTTPEFLRDHPGTVERVLRVHAEWTSRLAGDAPAHVPALAAAMEKLTSKKLSEAIIASAISRVTFTTEPLADSLKTFAQWAFDLKQARVVPDLSTLVDTSLLSKVLSSQPAGSSPLAPATTPTRAPATPPPGKP